MLMLLYAVPESDPFFNLALEDYLLHESVSSWLLLWRSAPAVILGRHQNLAEVVDRTLAESHGLQVAWRLTGGGAVLQDRQSLTLSLITPVKKNAIPDLVVFMNLMARALTAMGAPVSPCIRNELRLEGRTVAVFTHRLQKARLLQQCVLRFDSGPTVPVEVVRRPSMAPMGSLRAHLDASMTVETFAEDLVEALALNLEEHFWRVERPVDEAGLAAVLALRDKAYASPAWNDNPVPACDLRNSVQSQGGFLECLLWLDNGRIRACTLHGDIMSLLPPESAAEALIGCPYEPADVERRLTALPFAQHFGDVSLADVLKCLFPPA